MYWKPSVANGTPNLRESLSYNGLDELIDPMSVERGQFTEFDIENQAWFANPGPIEATPFLDVPVLPRVLWQCFQLEQL